MKKPDEPVIKDAVIFQNENNPTNEEKVLNFKEERDIEIARRDSSKLRESYIRLKRSLFRRSSV